MPSDCILRIISDHDGSLADESLNLAPVKPAEPTLESSLGGLVERSDEPMTGGGTDGVRASATFVDKAIDGVVAEPPGAADPSGLGLVE